MFRRLDSPTVMAFFHNVASYSSVNNTTVTRTYRHMMFIVHRVPVYIYLLERYYIFIIKRLAVFRLIKFFFVWIEWNSRSRPFVHGCTCPNLRNDDKGPLFNVIVRVLIAETAAQSQARLALTWHPCDTCTTAVTWCPLQAAVARHPIQTSTFRAWAEIFPCWRHLCGRG